MKNQSVEYGTLPGLSKLFNDFVYQPDRLDKQFGNLDIEARADNVLNRAYDREAIQGILMRQNQNWKAPEKSITNISKLSNADSLIVTGGQQASLFGGPYMIIIKGITVLKQAELLEKRLGRPVIPVFSIAADDHDYQEISSGRVFNQAGELVSLNIDYDPDKSYRPVGAISYDSSVERELARLFDFLPENEFKPEMVASLNMAYRSGNKITDCFAEYILSLLGKYGLVIFNPYDAAFKKMAAPFMQAVVEKHASIKTTLAQANSSLTDDGYHLQVQKSDTAVHLFYNQPERTAIHFKNEKFVVSHDQFSTGELTKAIVQAPLDFSPDVLLKPVMQASLMPIVAIVGGSSEVAYYAQLLPLFDLFEIGRPQIIARSSATLVEKKFEKMLEHYDLSFSQIAEDIEAVIRTVLTESFPEGLALKFSNLRQTIAESVKEIDVESKEMAPHFSGLLEKTAGKIDYQLKEAFDKLFSAHKKRNRSERDKFYQLTNHLWAGGNFSERSVLPVYFISRYGPKVIDFMYENIKMNETGHQLLMLWEYNG